MQKPVDVNALRDFQEWKEKCDVKGLPFSFLKLFFYFIYINYFLIGLPFCSLPNACPLTTRELPGEVLRLHTCMECPNNYPWYVCFFTKKNYFILKKLKWVTIFCTISGFWIPLEMDLAFKSTAMK